MGHNPKGISEIDLVHRIANGLRESGWSVQEEPLFGYLRPDIVAVSPRDNRVFVIELKVGDSPSVHFGALAQMNQYRDAVRAKHGDATPILVTNAAIHEQVQHAADGLGIKVFSGAADALPNALFSGLGPLAD